MREPFAARTMRETSSRWSCIASSGMPPRLELAAGEKAGALAEPLPQSWKAVEHPLDPGVEVRAGVRERAEPQVVAHAELGKDLPAFRYQDEPGANAPVRCIARDRPTLEPDLPASRRRLKSGKGAHQRRLAGSVRAEHGDALPFGKARLACRAALSRHC